MSDVIYMCLYIYIYMLDQTFRGVASAKITGLMLM
jgi:hypothetical protein